MRLMLEPVISTRSTCATANGAASARLRIAIAADVGTKVRRTCNFIFSSPWERAGRWDRVLVSLRSDRGAAKTLRVLVTTYYKSGEIFAHVSDNATAKSRNDNHAALQQCVSALPAR